MPELAIGKKLISYSIRTSDRATRKRIIITPQSVEVVTPVGAKTAEVVAFVHKKRRWVFDKQQEMEDHLKRFEGSSYSKLQSGSKVAYWGRNVRVRISSTSEKHPFIRYQGGLHIHVPKHITQSEAEVYAATELTFWLKKKLKTEAQSILAHYASKLELEYKALRIGSPAKLWGSCTPSGAIQLNWHLITAPKLVLEYVVLHELCHIKYRNHSKEFWQLIAKNMPDYKQRIRLLEQINPLFKL